MKGKYPYVKCPVYTSDHFLLRLVSEKDAKDLLQCYADATAVRFMNADNCDTDFHFTTVHAMSEYIQGWLGAYRESSFVRFSIIDNQRNRAIGTMEMYDKTRKLGIFRLDLCAEYEAKEVILELLTLATAHFYAAFEVQQIAMKAIPDAVERISALHACGFVLAKRNVNGPYGDYYIRDRRIR